MVAISMDILGMKEHKREAAKPGGRRSPMGFRRKI